MTDPIGERVPLTLEQASRAVQPPRFTDTEWRAMHDGNRRYHAIRFISRQAHAESLAGRLVFKTYAGGDQRRARELHPEGVPE